MATESLNGKGIFFGNIKGGVGKSTLCVYTCIMLKKLSPRLNILVMDTDIQGTTSRMLTGLKTRDKIQHIPMSERHGLANLTRLDAIFKSHLLKPNSLVMVDSPSGPMGSLWQLASLCNAMIMPTSLSWTDMEPTLEYIGDITARKEDFGITQPHIIVVPNRNAPNQKDYGKLHRNMAQHDVILAPPVCDYSTVRHASHDFRGLPSVEGTRFGGEVEALAQFILTHVRTGKLDEIYASR